MGKRPDLFERWVEDGEADANLAIIQSLAMQGKTVAEIGAEFGTSERNMMTLQKKHAAVKSALKNGRKTVVAMCQSKLMEQVRAGETTAIIYALKVYGGEFFNDRRFVSRTELTGRDGAEIEIGPKVVVYLPQKQTLEDGELEDGA